MAQKTSDLYKALPEKWKHDLREMAIRIENKTGFTNVEEAPIRAYAFSILTAGDGEKDNANIQDADAIRSA